MRIVIAGGTGFLGSALAASLGNDQHDIVILTRRPGGSRAAGIQFEPWTPDGSTGKWAGVIDGAGVVVNLAGESIAAKRWTEAQKKRILDSRVNATRSLVAAIAAAAQPPQVFVSGSAVGYYGPRGGEPITEATPAGSDFLADVCVHWEAEAHHAASSRTRVACIRTGLVLAKEGGALPEMLPPFRFLAGGPVGSGHQYWPWIHRNDWVGIVRHVIDQPRIIGAINATGPNPVTNAEFARALGRAMRRPSFMPAPSFALKLLLGEMADALLLSGQRALPAKAQQLGYRFAYEHVENALQAIFG